MGSECSSDEREFRYKEHNLSDVEEKLLSSMSKIFNNDYFFSPNYDYYFNSLINDINRINTDILSKSYLNNIENEEGEMLNYVYLAYVEMWGYSYYYQSYSEKDYRFRQLIEVLDKVYHHEIEIFSLLFNSLIKNSITKFDQNDLVLKY